MTLKIVARSALALCLGVAALPAAFAADSAMMHKGMMKHHMKKDSMHHETMKKSEPAAQ